MNIVIHKDPLETLAALDVLNDQAILSLAKNPTGYDCLHTTQLTLLHTLIALTKGDTNTRTWLSGRITEPCTSEQIVEWRERILKKLARTPLQSDDMLTKKFFIAFQLIYNMEIHT